MAVGTKNALAVALRELLNRTTLDHITVKDIVEYAQVSRQTFYYHFSDVYALLDWTFQSAVEQLCSMPSESWRDRLLVAVNYLRNNQSFVMNVYHSLGLEYMSRGLEHAIRPLVQDRLQSLTSEWGISEVGEEFAVSFFTYGVIGSLIRWLDDGMPEDLDQVINDIHNLIHPKEKETLLPSYGGVDDDKKTM